MSAKPGRIEKTAHIVGLMAVVAVVVIFQFLAVPAPVGAASCGNLVCETASENKVNCPSDCCLRVKNGICNSYAQCLQYDPDCCAPAGCVSSEYACSASNTKLACLTGRCSGGACTSSCTSYLECAGGYCSGPPAGTKSCTERAAPNAYLADAAQSCRECYSAGVCSPCASPCLSLNSQGYGVYKSDAVVISYKLSSTCIISSPVVLSVSGPLRKYATLSTQSFSSIGIGETKQFSVTVSGMPAASYAYGAYAPGEYELKLSAISGVGVRAADLSYVFVLPSTVFSSGMDVPSNRIIGHSVRETLMKQGLQVVPVELEVWAW